MKTKVTLLSILFILTACYPSDNKQLKESGIITQEISQTIKMSNKPIKVSNKTTNIKHTRMVNKEWVQFFPESSGTFSESFKKRITNELLVDLHEIIGDKVSASVFEFILRVDCQNLNLTSNKNHIFITASISTVFAKSYFFTIGWTSTEFSNPLEIQRSDISNKKVDFYFCEDFPTQQIISDLKPTETISKKKSGYKFDIEYYLYLFPDVTVFFEFSKEPSEVCLKEIKNELEKYNDKYKSLFIGDFEKRQGYYTFAINYNNIDFFNYTDADFEKDINSLNHLLTSINNNNQISDLITVIFQ